MERTMDNDLLGVREAADFLSVTALAEGGIVGRRWIVVSRD